MHMTKPYGSKYSQHCITCGLFHFKCALHVVLQRASWPKLWCHMLDEADDERHGVLQVSLHAL